MLEDHPPRGMPTAGIGKPCDWFNRTVSLADDPAWCSPELRTLFGKMSRFYPAPVRDALLFSKLKHTNSVAAPRLKAKQ